MADVLSELTVKIGADLKGLKAGLDKADKQTGGFVKSIKKHHKAIGIGMLAIGGIIAGVALKSVKDYAKMGDAVHKMSLRTGFATETLSRLGYAARIGGADLESIEKAVKRMATTLYDAEKGLSTATDALRDLGLSIGELMGLSPEQQFMKLAGAIAAIEDPSMRSALAQRIFGRVGTELLPMLSNGTQGLKDMMAEAEKFGAIFSEEAAQGAADLTDALEKLDGTMNKLKISIAGVLTPTMIPLIEKMAEALLKASDWAEKNPRLAETLTLVAVALGGLLIGLGGLFLMLPGILAAAPFLGAVFAALTGPIGIIILAIGWLIAAGWLVIQNWEAVKEGARIAWQAITDTIVSAVNTMILWKDYLLGAWNNLRIWTITTFDSIKATVGNAVNWIIAQINRLISYINMIPAVSIAPIAPVTWGAPSGSKWIAGAAGYPVGGEPWGGGGIATEPQWRLIGEAGPEAIIPLGKGFGGDTTIHIHVAGSVITERDLFHKMHEFLLDYQRQNTTVFPHGA